MARRFQLWGWGLFVVSALFFVASAWRSGDLLALLGALAIPWISRWVPALQVIGGANPKRALVLVAGCLPLAAGLSLDAVARRVVKVPVSGAVLLLATLAGVLGYAWTLTDPEAPAMREVLRPQLARQALLVLGSLPVMGIGFAHDWR